MEYRKIIELIIALEKMPERQTKARNQEFGIWSWNVIENLQNLHSFTHSRLAEQLLFSCLSMLKSRSL